MNISMLPMANRLNDELLRLRAQVQAVQTDGYLHVTIDGIRVDAEMVALVQPVIMRELAHRVALILADLDGIGIDVVPKPHSSSTAET